MPGSGSGTGTFSPKTYQGALSVNDDRNDSGLYLMGHRHYAPDLGRFISRDPIGFQGGLNLFNGHSTSPVTFVDPSGLEQVSGSGLIVSGCKDITKAVGLATVDGPLPVGDVPAAGLATRGVVKIGVGVYRNMTSPGAAPAQGATPQEIATGHLATPGLSKGAKRHWKTIANHDCKNDDVYTRFGNDWEDAERLGRDAANAEKSAIGILGRKGLHGVSITARPPWRAGDSQAPGDVVRDHFGVEYTPTKNDPLHHTLILPKPVNPTVELLFNGVFGRSPY